VLEVVCIKSALGESLVGQDVIVIDNDVQGVALFCESVLDLLEDLGMGNSGRAYGDLNGLCCGGSFGSFGCGGFGGCCGGGRAAACGKAEYCCEGQDKSNDLFHF